MSQNQNTNTNANTESTENRHSEKSSPESETETESATATETEAEAEPGVDDETTPTIEIGDMVHDVEDNDPDDAVVVNTPPLEADEWTVSNSDTVASTNPGYPEDSTVIVVIFLSTLTHTDAYSDWDGEDPIGLPADCKTYAFPRGRLRRVGTYPQPQHRSGREDQNQAQSDTDTPDQETQRQQHQEHENDHQQDEDTDSETETEIPPVDRLTTGQQNLRERLSARSEVDVEPDPDDPASAVLVVQKLGEEHRIAADGTVSDGPVADRLAEIAHEYLS